VDYTITIPSTLEGFTNTETKQVPTATGREMFLISGVLDTKEEDRICPCCGKRMHVNDGFPVSLRHISIGGTLTTVRFSKERYLCPNCAATSHQHIPFKAPGHRITVQLLNYAEGLLEYGLTNKAVSHITGLGQNTVKDIDLKRLKDRYTTDGVHLRKPEKQARYLGIDEFKLHDGHKYAVVIVDMDTGHIIWLAHGKKKATVHQFIDFVGAEWMSGVKAVACDMNSDFQDAFEQRCPHITVVHDHFHIVKNLNDKVISEVRKDEQRRLLAEGDAKGAQSLKKTKYILTSRRSTLERKDLEGMHGKSVVKECRIFSRPEVKAKTGFAEKYDELISQNKLLFTLDLIKEKLDDAYSTADRASMETSIYEIMALCSASGNPHLMWFYRLLDGHFEGIVSHATYGKSTGKIEGINNKIKTIRRQGYGYPDDDYFFLKLFDSSRKGYVRNTPSHKICD